MASKKRRRQFATQAAQEALLRFGPELSGLKAAEQSYRGDYRAARNQAQAGAEATQAAIAQYAPALAAMFDQTGLATANAAQRLRGADLEGLGAVADSIKAGASLEAEGATNRMNALKAMSVGELVRGAALAPQAAQFSIGQARQTRDTNLGKVAERRRDIEQEIGAFTQSRAGELGQEAAQRALTNRINLRSVRGQARRQEDAQAFTAGQKALDRANRLAVADKSGKPKSRSEASATAFERKYGVKPRTPGEHQRFKSELSSVGAVVRDQIASGNASRADLGRLLTLGRPSKKVKASNGQEVTLPAIRARDPLVVSTALDLVFDKHVGPGNAKDLRRGGLMLRQLGVMSPEEYRRRRKRRSGTQIARDTIDDIL